MLPDPARQGLRASIAATGRVNLYALQAGVLAVDAAAVTALNRVNPMITLACLRPFARVAAGAMVATVKIISYGVDAADVARACALIKPALNGPALIGPTLQLKPPLFQTASLIETVVGIGAALPDPGPKGRAALQTRLGRLGVRLTGRQIVAQDRKSVV